MAQPSPQRQYNFHSGNAIGDYVDHELNTLYTVLQGGIGDIHVATDAALSQSKFTTTVLGKASVTSNQTVTGDLAGLSVTVTVPTGGRYIRISAQCQFLNSGTNYTELDIKEGSTTLMTANTGPGTAGISQTIFSAVTLIPSAGSHTYKLAAIPSAGTSTLVAASTEECYILVEIL